MNGVTIDGTRMLHPGDAIFIAKYTLMYQDDQAPATVTAPTIVPTRDPR